MPLQRPAAVAIACVAIHVSPACGGAERVQTTADTADQGHDSESAGRARVPADDGDDQDGMVVTGTRGHLDRYDKDVGLEPGLPGFRQCFATEAVGRGYLGGRVELVFHVARDRTTRVDIGKATTLGARTIERCLLSVARPLSFAKPKGGDATFRLPLDFPQRSVVEVWTPDEVENDIGDKRDSLAECRSSQAVNAIVTYYVGARGAVLSVGVAPAGDAAVADEWADCITELVRAWMLSDPLGVIKKGAFHYKRAAP